MAQDKSFKQDINPAMQFISSTVEKTKDWATPDPPEGFKKNPLYVETKSKRFQMLLQPSLYEKIKARANDEGKSVNEMIHSILEESFNEID